MQLSTRAPKAAGSAAWKHRSPGFCLRPLTRRHGVPGRAHAVPEGGDRAAAAAGAASPSSSSPLQQDEEAQRASADLDQAVGSAGSSWDVDADALLLLSDDDSGGVGGGAAFAYSEEEDANPYAGVDGADAAAAAAAAALQQGGGAEQGDGSPALEALLADAAAGAPVTLERLEALFPFELDGFQRKAVAALLDGRSVVVCAPTGAGKTAIADAAAAAALARGQRVIYTTPLKALSNQKLLEARARFGVTRCGLQTGDTSLNPDGSIVVMTTEILRNIMYRTAETAGRERLWSSSSIGSSSRVVCWPGGGA